MIWQLNKFQYPVYNLGSGKRFGIWVQGCSSHCNGCINPSTWNIVGGKGIDILDVFSFIQSRNDGFDGITITGGEPFDQYRQLLAFSLLVKRRTKLNILCYSGYRLRELEEMYPDKAFYKCLDFLVDGKFEKNNKSSNPIKGSENQNVYEFIDGKVQQIELRNLSNKWSLKCEEDTIYMAGIPKENILTNVVEKTDTEEFKSELI